MEISNVSGLSMLTQLSQGEHQNNKAKTVIPISVERDENGDTALMRAVKKGEVKDVKNICENLSSNTHLINLISSDDYGNTVLTMAVRAVKERAHTVASLRKIGIQNATNNAEIITVCLTGISQEDYIKALEERNSDGTTALEVAILTENVEAIEALLKGLSQDNHLKILRDLLTIACRKGSPKVIEALLKGLSQVNYLKALAQLDRRGDTALNVTHDAEKMRVLLKPLSEDEHMEALTIPDSKGCTPLLSMSMVGNIEALKALLEGLPLHKQQLAVAGYGHGKFKNYTVLDGCIHGYNDEQVMKLLTSLEAPCSIDRPLSEIAKEHLLHIRFSLKGEPEHSNPDNVIYQSLADSLYRFIQGDQKKKDDRSLRDVEAAFLNTTAYQFLPARTIAERIILHGESVVIPTGWPGHSAAVVFSNGLVMKCNRGPNLGHTGIEVFEPSSPFSPNDIDKLTEVIKMLRQQDNPTDFFQNLDADLQLKKLPLNTLEKSFVHRKGQVSGNCLFASAKTAFAALLFAKFRDTPERLNYAALLYKQFTAFDRVKALKENPKWKTEHPEATQKTHRAVARANTTL